MDVKRNGYYSNKKQRWWCKSCKRSFSIRNKRCKQVREQVWFKRWIVEGYSVRQLSQQSGHSSAKLYRIIDYWLSEGPNKSETTMEKHRYLILDGTFLHRPVSIIALMDTCSNSIIHGQYGLNENSERQLRSFFNPLIARGLNLVSCTVDGNPQAIRVLKALWPEVIIQRCVVHIQRQGLMWCRRYPKTAYARKLRDIFLRVVNIRSKEEANNLLEAIIQWEEQYGQYTSRRNRRKDEYSAM